MKQGKVSVYRMIDPGFRFKQRTIATPDAEKPPGGGFLVDRWN
jgi:hypothetical protein